MQLASSVLSATRVRLGPAPKTVTLGDTGWSAEFNDKEITKAAFDKGTKIFTVTKEFPDLTPIDIKFTEEKPAAADAAGLNITLNETVKNTSTTTDDWTGFHWRLLDTNDELKPGDNANIAENEPGLAHFHHDPGINDAGQVVGRSGTAVYGGEEHAFITGPNGVGLMDLNSLITLPAGITLTQAVVINNAEQIVAIASIPEPEIFALFLVDLGLIGFMARRRKAENGV